MEWIANTEGPVFLVLYAAVIATVLFAAYLSIRWGSSNDKVDPLVPVLPNPYEMAFMRGGEKEVAKLVLIELARRGYIQERVGASLRGGKAYLRRADSHPRPDELSPPLRKIFNLIDKEDQPVAKLIGNRDFSAAIEEIKQSFHPRIEGEGLIVGDFTRMKVLFVSALIIIGLGGYKLTSAIAKANYNVGFLILFAIVALIALWGIVNIRLTWRGRKYFRNTQDAYRQNTSDVVLDVDSAPANDMLLHVGLFGAPILFGTNGAMYATMLGLDPNARYGSSGCGSACGSSCSSGGDGGSGCGGGCGGCGGD